MTVLPSAGMVFATLNERKPTSLVPTTARAGVVTASALASLERPTSTAQLTARTPDVVTAGVTTIVERIRTFVQQTVARMPRAPAGMAAATTTVMRVP